MAETFTPADLANMEAQTAFLATLNQNFAEIATLLTDVLSRSGEAPNQMNAVLDMDSNRIINLPSPVNPTDPLRLQDISGTTMIQWIVIGSGAPGALVGFDGQVYIDKLTFNLYQSDGSTWTLIGSIQGPNGPGTGDMLKSQNLSGLASDATARTNLGLAIGTNVQAFDTTLAALSAQPTQTFGIALLNASSAAALQALLTLGGAALLNVGNTAGTVAAGDDPRFVSLFLNAQNGNYTFQLSDRGALVNSFTSASPVWTIPPNVFSPGDVLNVRAGNASGGVTLTRGSGVNVYLAGTSTNKDYALAATGAGSLICDGPNTFYILGAGFS